VYLSPPGSSLVVFSTLSPSLLFFSRQFTFHISCRPLGRRALALKCAVVIWDCTSYLSLSRAALSCHTPSSLSVSRTPSPPIIRYPERQSFFLLVLSFFRHQIRSCPPPAQGTECRSYYPPYCCSEITSSLSGGCILDDFCAGFWIVAALGESSSRSVLFFVNLIPSERLHLL